MQFFSNIYFVLHVNLLVLRVTSKPCFFRDAGYIFYVVFDNINYCYY